MMNSNSISEPQNNMFDSSHHNFPYKDLIVWQRSIQFASEVMDLTETLRITRKNYRLFEQMEAAVTSIPMNIAEGKGRISKKEFCHFLMIARGSLYETLTLLEIFMFRSWISEDVYNQFENQAKEISIKINALYKSISKSI
ncbi:MAG: four helix bundle protein [Chloroflexi bacterium HGW-Chloroflexi-3]|nr:MAG: four helix bundle protein [Chloroflexi bacterium HGW-Chloroflexi-3]